MVQADRTTVVLGPGQTPMRWLSPAERASLSPRWDADVPVCTDWTVPVQAALRIRVRAMWGGRSSLHGACLPSELQATFWPGAPHVPRSPIPDWERTFDYGSFYGMAFKPALSRAGLTGTRFHDLRHTYASLMFAAGIEPYKVSRWMGHGSLAITDQVYAHLHVLDHSADATRVESLLGTLRRAR